MCKVTNPFYNSKRWKRKREAVLKRDEYLCQECKRYGKTTPATVVHHIFPLEQYPELRLNDKNLISLCYRCHEQMHNKMTGELTEKGKQWAEKVSPLLFDDRNCPGGPAPGPHFQ